MRILYAIQGTGNGHLSRANDIIPLLKQYGEVDILVSGNNTELNLPFEIKYRFSGLSFVFGKNGDISFMKTIRNIDFKVFNSEIRLLPIKDYDMVVNDFEPVSSWAAILKSVPCYALSHQAAVANKFSPKPDIKNWAGQLILKYYAPAKYKFGFHFESYAENIFTPVIRKQVRYQRIVNRKHYTVYLPAYGDEVLVKKLSQFNDTQWEIFSKHCKEPFKTENMSIFPINNDAFIKSMAASEGVLCGAGFETPAEALFLKKKLMVVPMKSQYEQLCNAESLKRLGVPVLKNLKKKRLYKVNEWINSNNRVDVNYPDITHSVIRSLMKEHFLKHNQDFLHFVAEL